MKFEGINFYPASVADKTLAQFREHEKHHGLSDQKLKEVYDLLKKQMQAIAPANRNVGEYKKPDENSIK